MTVLLCEKKANFFIYRPSCTLPYSTVCRMQIGSHEAVCSCHIHIHAFVRKRRRHSRFFFFPTRFCLVVLGTPTHDMRKRVPCTDHVCLLLHSVCTCNNTPVLHSKSASLRRAMSHYESLPLSVAGLLVYQQHFICWKRDHILSK